MKQARVAYETAQEELAAVPGAQTLKDKMTLKAEREKTFGITCRRIERDLINITGVIHDLAEYKLLPDRQRAVKDIKRDLDHQLNRFEQGSVKDVDKPIVAAINLLSESSSELDSVEANAIAAKNSADDALASLMGQVKNADKGGAPISDDVARIIARLHEHGIEAEPVCNLVQVTRTEWQPAIETYLKSNREALVVTEGREREAVAMIRRLPERENPFAARVVQPYHLRDHRWDESNGKLVGNLLVSENTVALSYLRALFGTMKCVETEEELEKNPRALTVDGMLSANFTTSRMRLLPQGALLFGKRLTHAEKMSIQSKLEKAADDHRLATLACERIAGLKKTIQGLGDLNNMNRRVSEDVSQATEDQAKVFEVQRAIESIDLGNIEPLRQAKQEKEKAWMDREDDQKARTKALATTEGSLRSEIAALVAARKSRDTVIAVKSPVLAHEDVDGNVLDDYRSTIDSDYKSYTERIASCETRIRRAEQESEPVKADAISMLDRYLARNGISLGTEPSHWRTALAWVKDEERRLTDTELVEKEGKVKEARDAAEEAFRNDVAVRMRESIVQMRTTIDAINKTLIACPAFSNGERYKFEVKPAEAHKAIYSYIMEAGDKGELDMFTLGDQAHTAIMQLLDDSEMDAKGDNPLDDYRTLFTFDLVISRDGRKDTVLSKRLGVGSNGEHRAPFYVIAGAAMAAAYRIDAGKHSSGAGLMLLDEAFYGMDQQNSLAAARFLDSIGLQMIMAAPEADHSKLAPMLDTIYELNRFEMEVFVDEVKVKEAAHRLLTSDMPSEHPDLIARMVESIQAESA